MAGFAARRRLFTAAASIAVARGFLLPRGPCLSRTAPSSFSLKLSPWQISEIPRRNFGNIGGATTAAAATATMSASGVQKNVLVPIADGSEEIEACTIINTLVRGGATVTLASVSDDMQITGSRGIKIVADCPISQCEDKEWDLVVCPGGMPGATHLKESQSLARILKKQNSSDKWVGAICASPAVVLAHHGILKDRKATCYPAPGFVSAVEGRADEPVVVDGNLVTSQGPATSLSFSLRLVQELFGPETAHKVADEMLYKGGW